MQINCPNCNAIVQQHRPPAKNDPGAGEAWVCFWCPLVICTSCYGNHGTESHADHYGPKKRPTSDGKKNKKSKKR